MCEQVAMLVQISSAAGQILLDLEPLEAEPGRETDPEHLHPQWGLMLEEMQGLSTHQDAAHELALPCELLQERQEMGFCGGCQCHLGTQPVPNVTQLPAVLQPPQTVLPRPRCCSCSTLTS